MRKMTKSWRKKQPNLKQMRIRKATHITRKNYYLTPEDREEIKKFMRANPDLANIAIGDKFGVSRTTITNLKKELRVKGKKR